MKKKESGEIKWVYDRGRGTFNSKGEVEYIDGVIIETTEQRRIAQENAELEERYRQVQKLESIGRLAGGIAHDLNNLLTPVMGYADLLNEELKIQEDQIKVDYTQEIINATLKAKELVQQLLSYGRKQTLFFKEIDINRVLQDYEPLLRQTLNSEIQLDIKRQENLPDIMADRGKIEQVIMNLIVNGQDAMPYARAKVDILSGKIDGDIARSLAAYKNEVNVIPVYPPFMVTDFYLFGREELGNRDYSQLNNYRLGAVKGNVVIQDFIIMTAMEQSRLSGTEFSNSNIFMNEQPLFSEGMHFFINAKHRALLPDLERALTEMLQSGRREALLF